MREKFLRFMYGRYGIDSLGKFLVIAGIIAMLIAGWTDSLTLVTLSWANIYKRSAENQWYLNKTYKLRTFLLKQKNLMQQRKTHHIYKCPVCKQKIRVPRGKGRIEIRCPRCNATFIKKS